MFKKFPWLLRLGLIAVFSALLVPCWIVYFANFSEPDTDVLGMSTKVFSLLIIFVIPILLTLFTFLTGGWRLSLVLFGTLIVIMIACGDWTTIPEKNRKLLFGIQSNLPVGTEVFCNGVSIGTVPFKIRVEELIAKVPRWETPPEQTWYFENRNAIYTWFPYDRFLRDRYMERFILDPAKGFAAFDAQSKYWFKFVYQGETAVAFNANERLQGPNFDKIAEFQLGDGFRFPTRRVHFDLLIRILSENDYKPSPEWVEYVARYSRLLVPLFFRSEFEDGRAKPFDIRWEEAIEAVARYRYGLSENPTPEECDRAIGVIFEELKNDGGLRTAKAKGQNYLYGPLGTSYSCPDPFLDRAVRRMGTATEASLRQYCRRSRSYANFSNVDDNDRTLIYLLGANGSPALFEETVGLYMLENRGFRELMSFRDERTVPLLKTLLRRTEDPLSFGSAVYDAANKCAQLAILNNPLLEPTARDYLAHWLPKINELGYYDSASTLDPFVAERLEFDWIDREELTRWVESLQIEGSYKTASLRNIRLAGKKNKKMEWDGVFQDLTTKVGEKLTLEKLRDWLKENPDRPIDELIDTLHGSEPDFVRRVKRQFLWTLLLWNKPEAEVLVRSLWKTLEDRLIVIGCLPVATFGNGTTYYAIDTFPNLTNSDSDEAGIAFDSPSMSPGSMSGVMPVPAFDVWNDEMGNLHIGDNVTGGLGRPAPTPESSQTFRRYYESHFQVDEPTLPDYFLPLLAELTDPKTCIIPAGQLEWNESPESFALLERWSESENVLLKQVAERSLKMMRARIELNAKRHELYRKLIAGEITPDHILPLPEPYVWNGEKYVPKGQ